MREMRAQHGETVGLHGSAQAAHLPLGWMLPGPVPFSFMACFQGAQRRLSPATAALRKGSLPGRRMPAQTAAAGSDGAAGTT